MVATEVIHKVQLIEGDFTPSESLDVINSLLREKINFHKIHRLQMCEGNAESNTSLDDSRVSQLMKEIEDFKSIYQEAKASKKNVRINSIIEIELI